MCCQRNSESLQQQHLGDQSKKLIWVQTVHFTTDIGALTNVITEIDDPLHKGETRSKDSGHVPSAARSENLCWWPSRLLTTATENGTKMMHCLRLAWPNEESALIVVPAENTCDFKRHYLDLALSQQLTFDPAFQKALAAADSTSSIYGEKDGRSKTPEGVLTQDQADPCRNTKNIVAAPSIDMLSCKDKSLSSSKLKDPEFRGLVFAAKKNQGREHQVAAITSLARLGCK